MNQETQETNSSNQLLRDVEWLEDNLNIIGRECDEVLNACEKLGGLSAEYFCEEFIFMCEDENGEEDVEALNRVHDDDYLKIDWRLA